MGHKILSYFHAILKFIKENNPLEKRLNLRYNKLLRLIDEEKKSLFEAFEANQYIILIDVQNSTLNEELINYIISLLVKYPQLILVECDDANIAKRFEPFLKRNREIALDEPLVAKGVTLETLEKSFGRSAMDAVIKGDLELLRFKVLSNGIPKPTKQEGASALHMAAYHGHINCVNYLLQMGANLNALCNQGYSVFHYAGMSNQLVMLEFLLSKGIIIPSNMLYVIACRFPSMDVLDFLITKGAPVNAENENGDTPIFTLVKNEILSEKQLIKIFNRLIQAGVDILHKNKRNETIVDAASPCFKSLVGSIVQEVEKTQEQYKIITKLAKNPSTFFNCLPEELCVKLAFYSEKSESKLNTKSKLRTVCEQAKKIAFQESSIETITQENKFNRSFSS